MSKRNLESHKDAEFSIKSKMCFRIRGELRR